MLDLFNTNEMKDVFSELEGYENRVRKYLAYKQLDVYSGNQDKYIYQRINQLYGKDACNQIQAITSINLATRIVNTEASIYKHPPVRTFANATEQMLAQIDQHYKSMHTDEKLKTANRYFRLGNQCAVQVVPKNGGLKTRILYTHQYDVIPMSSDPDAAEVYIIPLQASKTDRQDFNNVSDNINQTIADKNDADLAKNKYIIWSAKHNFMCNGLGQFLDPITQQPRQPLDEELINPIGRLPFIDVSGDKTLGFFNSGGNALSDFTITFGVILSDLGEIVKLQGYSQPVISSLEEPKSISVGPHRVLWLKRDKNEPGDKDPKFEFASPSPDLEGSLSFAENTLRMFLTSRGTDSRLITSGPTDQYASGFERLLAMVDRAEATAEDKVLFQRVEQDYFNLLRDWNNYLINTTDGFTDENKIAVIGEDVELAVVFSEPMQVMTQQEKEESVQRRLELGLLSRREAIKEVYQVEDDKADEMIAEIDAETSQVEPEVIVGQPSV